MLKMLSPRYTCEIALALYRLGVLRWWLICGEAMAIMLVPVWPGIALPIRPMLIVLALQAVGNGLLTRRLATQEVFTAPHLFFQLVTDVLALSVLMLLSGGAANPLISLLLLPVAIAALSLSPRHVAAIAALSIVAYSLLNFVYLPLPIDDVGRAARLHLAGMWLSFVVSVILIAWFVVRLTASLRRRDGELAAAREQSLRDEQVVALGTLAAGAAHELSTPLSTIAVVLGELGDLAREQGERFDQAVRADIELLQKQVANCKAIISRLTEQAGIGRLERAAPEAADHWLCAVHARWLTQRLGVSSRLLLDSPSPAPGIVTDPILEQALLNLFNNAANAGAAVTVNVTWQDAHLTIQVSDNGTGFPEHILATAGRAPFPAHAAGCGLGLYLAQAAITRLGGELRLFNDDGGVAEVRLPAIPAH